MICEATVDRNGQMLLMEKKKTKQLKCLSLAMRGNKDN